MKHVLQYGVFAAYHLALETSFLADEGATLPEFPLNSPITVALPDKSSTIERSISTIPGFTLPASEKTLGPQSVGEPQRSNSVPISNLLDGTIVSVCENQCYETYNLPASMSSQYVKPSISSSIEGFQHPSLDQASNDALEDQALVGLVLSSSEVDRVSATGDTDIHSDSKIKTMQSDYTNTGTRNSLDLPSLQPDGKQIPEEQPALKEEFPPSPSDHQSILVSLSSRCVWKGTICERSHLFRIKYYGSFDKPLGRFLRDHLFDQVTLLSLSLENCRQFFAQTVARNVLWD